jgi:hypothetical protein
MERRFVFTLTVIGEGSSEEDAFADALTDLSEQILDPMRDLDHMHDSMVLEARDDGPAEDAPWRE